MKASKSHRFSALVLVAALAAPSVHAQTNGDKAAAEALFQAGRDLMGQGKFSEACGKFEASQRLDAGLGTLLYLADCYEKANMLASSWATFHEAESIAMGRSDASRAEIARQRASALEPRLSKLWIKVKDGNPSDIAVMRDGQPVPRESWGIALPTDAGDHTIEAKAAGHKPWSAKVVVVGEASNVPVEVPLLEVAPEEPKPAPAPAAAPADRGAETSSWSSQKTVGLVVGGVGVVGLGLSTLFTLKAKSKNDDSKANGHCPNDPNVCDADGTALRKDAISAAKVATAFGIAGGVFLAGGVVLFLTAPSGEKPKTARPALEFHGGPSVAAVTLKGSF
ncbi:MAG TPA: hypothetical protein VHE30_10675 [Polyangiaceae bacterium]|nr:hypothetical protein [Polyangiaceae bacterium]